MSEANKQNKQVKENSNSKIETIKNLIFGENIVEYDNEFEAIKNDILEKKVALENLISTTEIELKRVIDNLSTDLNIRLTGLSDSIENKIEDLNRKKVNRKDLGDLLIKLGSKISE
ncbi:fructose 1,6-bisphosphatase [Seonamhaeicola marinus]|uniref:Fructose 1,6-bisphosphatase n=1 Tax=Seonamhaeicola marinus TaxID=1912246 RepID=A0A5D0IWM0_9FLAO|nr:fructose 1,6-bisphosphatase [Seonamhaeicola marinus]TYA86747.1 fructose 1,6-bisphosphatase [Seonamhaeicola marinus]